MKLSLNFINTASLCPREIVWLECQACETIRSLGLELYFSSSFKERKNNTMCQVFHYSKASCTWALNKEAQKLNVPFEEMVHNYQEAVSHTPHGATCYYCGCINVFLENKRFIFISPYKGKKVKGNNKPVCRRCYERKYKDICEKQREQNEK
jgi:hypothetical protein